MHRSLLFFLFALLGCSGRTVDVGETEQGTTSHALATARATCDNGVHGPVDNAAKKDLPSSFTGKWLGCSSSDPRAMFAVEGIELMADGSWHLLTVQNGELVPVYGIDKEGTWEILPATPDYVYVKKPGGGVVPTDMSFETVPRRMKTVEATSGFRSWLLRYEP